jgi:putative endonuclease
MHYCYILYSEKLDKYYIGSTSNIEGRLSRHNSSSKGFTSTGKPWILKYYEVFESKKDAMQRELELKRHKSRKIIESLIGDRLYG